ncbi:MAG: nitrogenase cofactor biosynthesis protein NifB, partial [Anaeromyxobacteraceae bacterium]|nr:nitrogenase cofactor biosynthesis protein NifB [Anaeromyxobacteraceae bacterium]
RERDEAARRAALRDVAGVAAGLTARVAVATKGEGLVNQHFGHAREFLVYEVGRDGARLLSTRAVDRYCRGGEGEEDALATVVRALSDCQAVLISKVGHCPKGQLAAAGLEPVVEQAHQPIEAAALAWFAGFAARVARGEVAPPEARREPTPTAEPLAAAGAAVA